MLPEFPDTSIIGMSFKFPQGAEDPDTFWKTLLDRRCTATEFPKDRFNIDAFWNHDSKMPNHIKPREAHFLEGDVAKFDAGFFSMPPHEVGSMDPQQRGLMETTYHALENAGLTLEDVSGSKTSVHIGCFTNDWAHMQLRDTQNIPKYNAIGSAGSILANRLSWFYNLHGESMYIDTACSSSLVAMALACRGLSSGSSDMAIVGASNLILGPEFNIALSNLNFLSPSGRCKSFSADGDGYGRGEGFTTLILKPVSKAITDGNPIRAVIRSFGMNQDGYTSGGITQPSKEMQVQLIRDTYQRAGLSMADTRFFEAHGTGTAVGDPIEARAIGESFQQFRKDDDPIYVGAFKSNFGHLEGTSGLASVVKTVLSVERGMIPPNTNFTTLNPNIDAEFLKLSFPTSCVPWPAADVKRASVNAFGFGGSNAHIVIESAEDFLRSIGHQQNVLPLSLFSKKSLAAFQEGSRIDNAVARLDMDTLSEVGLRDSRPQLLVLSATDEDGNARQAKSLATFFSQYTSSKYAQHSLLEDVLSTLNTRRTLHVWKSYAVLRSLFDFSTLENALSKPVRRGNEANHRLGFIFTGQGAQWPRMGIELLDWPIVKTSLARSQHYLQIFGCKWKLVDEISAPPELSKMNEPEFSQVISTAVQIALVDIAEYLGIRATVAVGHSSGEIAAAYCVGFLSHESAIRVSYFRGMLASKLSKDATSEHHGMASVGILAKDAPGELAKLEAMEPGRFEAARITISCINSPSNITISGPQRYLDVVVEHFASKNIFARKLKVDVGYHSPQMQAVSEEYLASLSNLTARDKLGKTHMVSSTIPGRVSRETVCSGEYWVRNMLSPVQFVDAMHLCTSISENYEIVKKIDQSHNLDVHVQGWLEIGPHSALKGPSREISKAQGAGDVFYTSFLQRGKPADMTTLAAIGELHCRNFHVTLTKIAALNAEPDRQPRIILDLPKYPFNHSTIYWDEPARSSAFRHRHHRYHPLLGAPAMDWNPLDAKWIWTMKTDEMPWVTDHQINGNILYPASGMIVMAIEAIKQLLKDHAEPLGFELSELSFLAPLVIANSSGRTETQLSMVPISNAGSKDAQFKFRIFTMRSNSTWQEICHGNIEADYGRVAQSVSAQAEEKFKLLEAQMGHYSALKSCRKTIGASDMYEKVAAMSGLQYGPTFQPLSDIHYDMDGRAYSKILSYTPSAPNHSYTIHPSTLDGVFQLAIPSLSKGLTVPLPTLVPSRLTRLWISTLGAGHGGPEEEIANIQAKFLSRRSAEGSFTVFSQSDLSLRVAVDELELTELARDDSSADMEENGNALCYEMEWKADHSILSPAEISDYCMQQRKSYEEPEQFYQDIELMLLSFAAQTLNDMKASDQEPIPSMIDYARWLQSRIDSYCISDGHGSNLLGHLDRHALIHNTDTLEKLTESVESHSSRGMVNATVGRNLKGILLGQVDPLQLLFQDDNFLLEFYEELNTAGKAFDMLNAYIDLLVHKDSGLKFLEIGAGTGATTTGVLNVLERQDCGTRYWTYTFTDISAAFFSKAQERFNAFGDRIAYRVLDIEEDPVTQGFHPEDQFDVIIAAHVLHATENLNTTLSNVRKLLKPNGKLIFTEMTTPNKIETGFIFGTLPGWWRSAEQWRKANASAVFLEEKWDTLLRHSGFTGTEYVFRDWDSDRCHGWSIMISSANFDDVKAFLVNKHSSFEMETADILKQSLAEDMGLAKIITFDDVPQVEDLPARHCLILGGLEKAMLSEIVPDDLKALQKVLTSSKSILWASCVNPPSATEPSPYWAMTEGLCRTCRSEDINIPIATVILERPTCESASKAASQIAKVFTAFQHGITTGFVEPEYKESSGRLCINRLTQAKYLDDHVSARTQKKVVTQEFKKDMPIKLDIRVPGFLDTLQWVDDESVYEPLEPHQVEVKVQAIGVNFKECLILLGRVKTDKLGSECAGYVHRIGSAVSSEYVKVGDRVALGSLESYRSFIPDNLSFVDAAAIPTAFCTAYHSLINVARLQKNESVLIHAAAGGTGQAAVQVAQHVGAEIFATVGSVEKKNLLMEQYAIPEDHIFFSRDSSFADGVKRMTQGRGVDVVLNSLSGKLLIASWELIANFGRFIEIGRRDIDSRGHLPMHPFIRNATFNGVDLATIVENPEQKDKYCLQEVFDLVEQGVFHASYPVQPYPIDQTEQALRILQSGRSSGKIVLEVTEGAVVPLQEGPNSRYRFSENATYVIAGGLGGIGRQITTWMARRGVRHILVLSRSGLGTSEEKRRVIADLEAKGVNVQYGVCDISDRQALEDTIQKASATMPPIKGCFQAAMVLRDRPFGTMSHEEWTESVRPKVQGSWNLHAVLPSGMDFFVMLSSTSGIFGNAGQSNYAAGNTFQDALAQYRTISGEKAIALDLGMILGEGFVAENKDIYAKLLRLNLLQPLRQEEIFAIFDFYCNPDTIINSVKASQVTTGIELPASILRNGHKVPEALQRSLFSLLHQIQPTGVEATIGTANTQDFSALLKEATTIQEAGVIVAEALKNKLCKILGVEPDERSVNDRMESFGVDSLLALELRNWLLRDIRADLAVFEILGDSKLGDIGLLAARKSLLLQKEGKEA
ncbi:reducing type I polyketide synthase [Lindgomyces ingoldianus]|uniref:Reducing type I polyketide synthase n=1 Tax=Lindgomyces ingoldianus TaxID=673940 RepID=A0ACB6QRY8_9PLEO|nr:reducing type I polyketide synthase [Lindgomyces ingoldianus]KAF2469062.1 reducing type I polyketide synthase [Lindgomyces ingoldianus]